MIDRDEVLLWAFGLPFGTGVAVDEGGLRLVTDNGDELEVGGDPSEDPMAEEEPDVPVAVQPLDIKRSCKELKEFMSAGVEMLEEYARARMCQYSDKAEECQLMAIRNALQMVQHTINGVQPINMNHLS